MGQVNRIADFAQVMKEWIKEGNPCVMQKVKQPEQKIGARPGCQNTIYRKMLTGKVPVGQAKAAENEEQRVEEGRQKAGIRNFFFAPTVKVQP